MRPTRLRAHIGRREALRRPAELTPFAVTFVATSWLGVVTITAGPSVVAGAAAAVDFACDVVGAVEPVVLGVGAGAAVVAPAIFEVEGVGAPGAGAGAGAVV